MAIEKKFKRLRTNGDTLCAWNKGVITGNRYTAQSGLKNHFQGLQRKGQYLFISGGEPDKAKRMSHLFVIKMESTGGKDRWGANQKKAYKPHENDLFVKRIDIECTNWHAGGLSLCGDILAVPIEHTGKPYSSKIVFYNVAKPENPIKLGAYIDRPKKNDDEGEKAGAVALTKLENGKYLVGVWSDSDNKARRMDFYISKSRDVFDGTAETCECFERCFSWEPEDADKFQTVNFVGQEDGNIYMVGLHNTSPAAWSLNGLDLAELYKISNFMEGPPEVCQVARKHFYRNDIKCNMSAAAGVFIDSRGDLKIYATYHWLMKNEFDDKRNGNILYFNEYGSRPDTDDLKDPAQAWIDLYEHDNFGGKCLSITGVEGAEMENYGHLYIEGRNFNNCVSSVKYQLPKGCTYTLYNQITNQNEDNFPLVGNGKVKQCSDLKQHKFGDKVSSSKYTEEG